ncbi:hypothetical protein PPERSA_03130 [Pseudocohnilembus persalinus]|uniref:Uncharacterized protein n=1 Tax=Pseudocohnilembus persalinus TaxID=266149 RepID=A0A0V0QIL0_PSEPJ|nr:hypothetical protein PPERSA_03130 [Pseudocohnilembus persalinus]|eukprot:KRX02068.1 hypothetical protein PPERSA_03130 [Pseudocohnilembus persalinus]
MIKPKQEDPPKNKQNQQLPKNIFKPSIIIENQQVIQSNNTQIFEQKIEKKIEYILSKELALQRPSKNSEFNWNLIKMLPKDQSVPFKVQEKKNFDYKSNCGHIWYKNMNIPQIKVSIPDQSQSTELQQKQIQAKMYSVRQQIQNKETNIVELSGKNEISLSWGECEFSGLRFTTTSYSHRGSRYFLVIFLVEKQGNNIQQISDYYVSPPIYVESRKKAYLERQTYFTQFAAFHPNKLEKSLQSSEMQVEPAENAQTSKQQSETKKLLEFLINPRIRLKIYHPIYLLFKFPEALELYINKQQMPIAYDHPDFFYEIQKYIQKICTKVENQKGSAKNIKLTEKLFILSINKNDENKENHSNNDSSIDKIMKILTPLEGPILTILSTNTESLPKQFQKLTIHENMIENYKQNYFHYSDMRQLQSNADNNLQNSITNIGSESDLGNNESCDYNNGNSFLNYKKLKTQPSINSQESNQISFHQACFNLSVETYPEFQRQSLTKISVFKNEEDEKAENEEKNDKISTMNNSFPKKFQKLSLNSQTNMGSSANTPSTAQNTNKAVNDLLKQNQSLFSNLNGFTSFAGNIQNNLAPPALTTLNNNLLTKLNNLNNLNNINNLGPLGLINNKLLMNPYLNMNNSNTTSSSNNKNTATTNINNKKKNIFISFPLFAKQESIPEMESESPKAEKNDKNQINSLTHIPQI